MTIRTIVVDDEPLARRRLLSFLSTETDFEVVAECANGREAVAQTKAQSPALMFLDIKMPDLDGLGVVAAIGPENMPATVFVTAYDEYALEAFDCHAIDYLLKPFDRERFQSTLRQVRKRLDSDTNAVLSDRLSSLIDDLDEKKNRYVDRLIVKSSRRLVPLKVEEIDWIDAAGNYVRMNADGKKYLLRGRISDLEGKLDPKRFLRIHRSTIVNTDAIREIRPLQHGEGLVILSNGQQLNLSRTYREKLARFFK